MCAMTRKVGTWSQPDRALKGRGLHSPAGKESGSRFGPGENKVSLPGWKLTNRVPGFSCVVQSPRDVLLKQSTVHPSDPDCQGGEYLNPACGAAQDRILRVRSPSEIMSNNGGVEHVSTVQQVHSLVGLLCSGRWARGECCSTPCAVHVAGCCRDHS